jgi:hypothetical protein
MSTKNLCKLFDSILNLRPSVTEAKFRNFEKKIASVRGEILSNLSGKSRAEKDAAVVSLLSEDVYAFMLCDGCNPNPRPRSAFRISEMDKTKIGFYAQFLTQSAVSEQFDVCTNRVKVYAAAYKFPVLTE